MPRIKLDTEQSRGGIFFYLTASRLVDAKIGISAGFSKLSEEKAWPSPLQ